MKGRIFGLFLFVVLSLSLAACHGRAVTDAFQMAEGLDPGRTYEITFWAKNDTNKIQVEI